MISYESSKWYVKAWRSRWYLYAVLLYLKEFLKIELIIDFILSGLLLGDDTEENRTFYHWKRLIFTELNSEQLKKISEFIIKNFSTRGQYSHLLPTLHSFEGNIALTFDRDDINEFLK